MSITASNIIPLSLGSQTGVIADLAISDNYTTGGLALDTLALLGIHSPTMVVLNGKKGLSLEYDYTNNKIKMFNPNTPPIVYDELQQAALATSAGVSTVTLNYPAAYIMNVAYGGQNYAMRSTGATPGANQCCLTSQMSDGVRTQLNVYTVSILTNGTFTGNATGWTLGAAWHYGTNVVNKDTDGVTTLVEDAGTPVINTYYDVTFTISALSVGSVTPSIGGASGTTVSDNGTYVQRILTVDGATCLTFTPSSTARFTIDSVSAVAVPSVRVTYVTQSWKEVWDNLVQDESITLATGDNTLGEVITATNDRTLAGASNWTNVNIATYDETTGGYMTLTSDAIGQYAILPNANAITVPGTRYKLTISSASLTGSFSIHDESGQNLIGIIETGVVGKTFDFVAKTNGGLRLTSLVAVSSVRIDNVSISPGNKILACMYVDQITATAAALTMLDENDTTASGEIRPMFNKSVAQLNCHSAQDSKVCKITYLKQPSSGLLFDHKFNDETGTGAGADPYTTTFDYPILIWGFTGQMPVDTGTTQVLVDYGATPAAGEVIADWFTPGIRGGGAPAAGTVVGGKSNVVGTASGVWGTFRDITDIRPLELLNGTSVSMTGIRVFVIGY